MSNGVERKVSDMDSAQEPKDQEAAPRSESEGRSRGRRTRLVLGGLIATAAVATAFIVLRNRHQPGPAESSARLRAEKGVLVASAGIAELRYIDVAEAAIAAPVAPLPAPGRVLVAESRATPIVAPLSGRVDEVLVQLGDRVKPGDRLVAVRSATLPELGREIETARAALGVRRASVARLRDLVSLGAVPEKDLLLAQQELSEAEIALASAEGKRRSFRLEPLDRSGIYWLKAPRAGTVVERRVLVGMEVGPDRDDPLLSIAEFDEVVVVADLLESDVAGVRAGQKATVALSTPGERPVSGTVEYVAAVVDPVRRTVAVRVRVPNREQRLRPNAFVSVNFIEAATVPQIVVPTEAVVTDGQRSVVFVREEKQSGEYRFSRREVRTGRSRDGKTEILEGLKQSERYVARGALLLLNTLDLES
jgi:membrane fusion protein, heavy metal efflux system